MVHDGLAANVATFATPPVTLANQQTAIDNLKTANVSWGVKGTRGSHSTLITRNAAIEVVINNLVILASYVTGIARTAGNPGPAQIATALLASMRPKYGTRVHSAFSKKVLPGHTRRTNVPDAPRNLRVLANHSVPDTVHGAVYLRWKKVKGESYRNAKTHYYNVYMQNKTTSVETLLGSVNDTTCIINLTSAPGADTYWFYVKALNISDVPGPASKPVVKQSPGILL
jgi:hypothetical protein